MMNRRNEYKILVPELHNMGDEGIEETPIFKGIFVTVVHLTTLSVAQTI
jgi:hypothetical protein